MKSNTPNATWYPPRTIADHVQIAEWAMAGLTTEEVYERMQEPSWRSEIVNLKGHPFCKICSQYINIDYCVYCLQAPSISQLEFIDWLEFKEYQKKMKARW